MGMLTVRGTQQLTCGRACRIGQTLELQGSDDVLGLVVGELIELVHLDGVVAGATTNAKYTQSGQDAATNG